MGLFGKMVFPRVYYKPIPDFHELMYRLLVDRTVYQKGIIAPRDHAKSTVTTFNFPMHRIAYNPRGNPLFIIIISEAQHQSIKFLNNIRSALKWDPVFHHYFGNLMVGENVKDTETEIITNNNCCILALGTGQRVRGLQYMNCRPHIVICDDFESEHNTLTLEARMKNKTWIAAAVENTLAEDGEFLVAGTIVHPDAYLIDIQNDPSWKTLHFDAEVNVHGEQGEGVSLWPERWPWERLMGKKESLISRGLGHLYYQEFRNMPSSPDELSFKTEDFCYWDGWIEKAENGQPYIHITWLNANGESERYDPPLVKPVETFAGVDLNSADHGDWGVILPLGCDEQENTYVDDYVRRRMDSHLVIEELFKMNRKFHFRLVVIETVAYQEQLKREFVRLQNMRDEYIPVKGEKGHTRKSRHHEEMIPAHRQHKIWIKKHHTELESEQRGYPKPPNDDCLDALWMARKYAAPPDNAGAIALVNRSYNQRQSMYEIARKTQANFKLW
jgi:hypothetical protein